MMQRYDSISDFATACRTIPEWRDHHTAYPWNGDQTFADALQNLYRGRDGVAERASKLLEKLSGDSIETSVASWEHDRVGFIPCVPSYLAGSPLSMLRPIEQQTDRAPIRVYASIMISAGLNASELEARGVAILALCQKLQAIRPLELWIYADLDGSSEYDHVAMPVIRIDTSPLDLTTVSYALTDPGFPRQLCMGWAKQYGYAGGWAWNISPRDDIAEKKRREIFQAEEQDLIIPGGYNSDPLIRQPVQWVNKQIAHYTASVEAGVA